MKTPSKSASHDKTHLDYKKVSTEATDFHARRMRRELTIEAKKESSCKPEGNDEYEQLVAEDASFNTRPMIEEAAFLLAEQRGFAPGNELSDWLQAEAGVEKLLRKSVLIERRVGGSEDRRQHGSRGNQADATRRY